MYFSDLKRLSNDEWRSALTESPDKAARWIYAAATYGDIDAQLYWAQMQLDGYGTKRDPGGAFRWFAIAAKSNRPDAVNMLGRCYERGWGVAADLAEAARLYRDASRKDDHWGHFNLGHLLLEGGGVPRDERTALSLFVRAARQGNPKAMGMIGRYCEDGWRGRVRPAAAIRWYRRAAERGCFRGKFDLGRLLFVGGSTEEATQWLQDSLDTAPSGFCKDAATLLAGHADPQLRRLGVLALQRASAPSSRMDRDASNY